MQKYRNFLSDKQTECGQSTAAVALSLGVFLLLIIGAVVLCAALFTVTTMEDYDEGNVFFDAFETQSISESEVEFNSTNPDSNGWQITIPSNTLQHPGEE